MPYSMQVDQRIEEIESRNLNLNVPLENEYIIDKVLRLKVKM